ESATGPRSFSARSAAGGVLPSSVTSCDSTMRPVRTGLVFCAMDSGGQRARRITGRIDINGVNGLRMTKYPFRLQMRLGCELSAERCKHHQCTAMLILRTMGVTLIPAGRHTPQTRAREDRRTRPSPSG